MASVAVSSRTGKSCRAASAMASVVTVPPERTCSVSSSSVWAESSVKDPTRVRRSAVRCPPTPRSSPRSRASARTYVPEEHVTVASTSMALGAPGPSPAADSARRIECTSNRDTVTGRAGSCTSSPLRTLA